MAPIGTRQQTRARGQQASLLRSVGRTWAAIAVELGFRSRQAAQQAATRYEAKSPPETIEAARRREGEALRIVKSVLFERLADAKERDDTDAIVLLSRELRGTSDAIAKLNGLHAPAKSQVDVNVHHSATAILERAEEQLLALTEGRHQSVLPVIDAEVVGA